MRLSLRFLIITLLFAAILQPSFAVAIDSPNKAINRAEALKILVESQFDRGTIDHALDEHRAKGHSYVDLPDVSINDWFSPYVEIAYTHGIVQGYGDKRLKPAGSINLAEGLKMVFAAYQIQPNIPFHPSKLLYVSEGDWFAPYFAYAEAKNLLNANKFYHPAQVLTRGEFVEIVDRLDAIQSKHLTHYSGDNGVKNSKEYTVTIPRLNIVNQPVGFADPTNEKESLDVLRKFPLGHYLSAPDSGKKFVLFGHSSGYAWDKSPYKVALRQINKLKAGDKIYINYQERGYVYEIGKTETIPAQEDGRIVDNPSSNEVVMYTCWPPDSIRQRYLVHAKPV